MESQAHSKCHVSAYGIKERSGLPGRCSLSPCSVRVEGNNFAEAQCQVTVLGASTPTSSSCCHLPLILPLLFLLIFFHSTPLTLPMKSSPPPTPLLPEIHQFDKLKTSSSHVMKPHTESPGRGQNAEGVGRSGKGRDQNTDIRERRVSALETQVW